MNRTITRRSLLLMLAPALLLAALACSSEEGRDAPEKVVFMAGFRAQANLPFVAAYVAQEMGYFAEQGLEVEIRHASTGEHLKLLMAGSVDFTTAAASSVLKRRADPQLPVVAFALFGQRGQQAYIALADSGIETPRDWMGRTFGYKTSVPPDYLAILDAADVDRSRITEVNAGFDVRVLTEGRVDILAVFKSNEPDILRKMGFALTTWEPESYGVPNIGLTYITRQELVDDRPEVVGRFLKATLRGVRYAMDNVEATLDIVLKYAADEDREHQRFMLESELSDAVSPLTDERGLGWMTGEQWRDLYDLLLDFKALPGPFDYEKAFTDRFLQEAYDEGELRWP